MTLHAAFWPWAASFPEEIAKAPWSLPAQTLEVYQLPNPNTVATSTDKLHGPQPHLEARSTGREGALAVSMGAVLLEITAYLIGSFRHEPDKPDVQITKLMTKPYMKAPCSSCWHGLQRMTRTASPRRCQPQRTRSASRRQPHRRHKFVDARSDYVPLLLTCSGHVAAGKTAHRRLRRNLQSIRR